MEERVEIIKMYAGADGRFINYAIDDGVRGLVIEGLGRGNVTVPALAAIDARLSKAFQLSSRRVVRAGACSTLMRMTVAAGN
jgi:L-asparaginase/Glu-tRNA(Gln) amidotransferase subunit D